MNDIDEIRKRLSTVYGDLVTDAWLSDRGHALNIEFSDRCGPKVTLEIAKGDLDLFVAGNPVARLDEHLAEVQGAGKEAGPVTVPLIGSKRPAIPS